MHRRRIAEATAWQGRRENFRRPLAYPSPKSLLCAQRKTRKGGHMKVFWGLGKLLTLLFWVLVLINLVSPLINPIHLLINLAGSLLLLTHLMELLLFNGSLKGRAHPWRDRLQILLTGIFHLQTFKAAKPVEAAHA
jgi:putative membrane protein